MIVREEPFASAEVEAALREAGVDVRTNCRAVSVARNGDVTVTMEDGSTASGDELLVAVGRKPNTESLGLESIGLDPGKPADFDLFEEEADVPQVPASLGEALDALETDHEFLTRGGVFSKELIETWIAYKRETEVDAVRLRPHPAEFALYYDC